MATAAGRITGKSMVVLAKLFTPSREALEFLGGDKKVEQVFAEGFGYLRKWFKSKEDLEFIENPLLHLTRSFVEDLNRICEKKRVVLFFDTYEYLSPFCNSWLCKVLLHQDLSVQTMLVIAGRDRLSSDWLDYQPIVRQIPLNVFTDEEAQIYLSSHGVTDKRIVEEILKASGKLPVYLAMLTAQAYSSEPESGRPTETVVERFLKWIPIDEPEKRRAVITCAFPRYFNKDLVYSLLESDTPKESIQDIFQWLRQLPFVTSEKTKGWKYHELVREQILLYRCQESLQEYIAIHAKALSYYRQSPEDSAKEEELYHLLHLNMEEGAQYILAEFLAIMEGRYSREEWLFEAIWISSQVEKERQWGNRTALKVVEYVSQIFHPTLESENFLQALAKNENFPSSAREMCYMQLGSLFMKLGQYNTAIQAYQNLLELNPEKIVAWYLIGLAYNVQGQYEEAIHAAQKALDLKTSPPKAPYPMFPRFLEDMQDQTELSLVKLQHHLTWEIEFDEIWNIIGGAYQGQKKNIEAIQAYQKVLEFNPKNVEAWRDLGDIYTAQKQDVAAINAYQKALEITPEDAGTWHDLGKAHTRQFQDEAAIQACRKALELNTDRFETWYLIGLVYGRQRKYAESIHAFQRALDINPEAFDVRIKMAAIYAAQKQFADAIQACQHVIETNPDYDKAWHVRGMVYESQGEYDQAEKTYHKAIKLKPDNAIVYDHLGDLLCKIERTEEAETAYHTVINLNPTDAQAHYKLARIYAQQNDIENAIKFLQKTAQFEPKCIDLAQNDSGFDKIREEFLFQSLFHAEQKNNETA